MQRPPRDPAAPLFSLGLMAWSFAQGLLIFAVVAGLFGLLLAQGMAADAARSLAFATLVCGNVALILANRSFSTRLGQSWRAGNAMLWRMLAITAALLAAVLWLAPLREVFRFAPLPLPTLALAPLLGMLMLLGLQLLKKGRDGVAVRPGGA